MNHYDWLETVTPLNPSLRQPALQNQIHQGGLILPCHDIELQSIFGKADQNAVVLLRTMALNHGA
jgi:hypothetical protein